MLPVRVWGPALGAAVLQVLGTYGASQDEPDRIGLDLLGVVLLLVGPAALLLRERSPLVPLVLSFAAIDVYLGTGHVYGPIFASVVLSLLWAAQVEPRARVWGLAALGWFGYLAAEAADPRSDTFSWLHVGLVSGWLIGVLLVGELARVRRERFAARARAQEEADRRAAGQRRLGVAQELHDVLAHHISLINVQAGVALHLVDAQPEQARTALANIKDASKEALTELRAALEVLRHGDAAGTGGPPPTVPAPTLADLDRLADAVRAGGLAVDLTVLAPDPLPAAVQLAAYRIVQEALTNVTRHAGARSATVLLEQRDGLLTVTVADDGRGAGPVGGTAADGMGISGMRERATSLGGGLTAGPGARGFVVTARLPVTS